MRDYELTAYQNWVWKTHANWPIQNCRIKKRTIEVRTISDRAEQLHTKSDEQTEK